LKIDPSLNAKISTMRFRLKGLAWHLLGSVTALTLVLGGLYLGWYRWPGWYLADAAKVTLVLASVDLVVGPLLTFVVASPAKPRRVLTRDIAIIATLQLCALAYGAIQLWNGRPLYYAFSEDVLQVVQAYDIDPKEVDIARGKPGSIVPHWYSLPEWIWAPLPKNEDEQTKIIQAAISGGDDVISMPRYYRPWAAGLPTLRKQLKRLDQLRFFSPHDKKLLTAKMQAAGLSASVANCIPFTGRAWPLLAVVDPATLKVVGIFRSK
jgi:hypothetical protein